MKIVVCALATAAFVMGPEAGIELLHRMGVAGLMYTPQLERYQTGNASPPTDSGHSSGSSAKS